MTGPELIFPVLGDAEEYEQLGMACAEALGSAGVSVLEGCTGSAYRPVGTSLYFALPKLVASDAVAESYVALLINLLVLLGVVAALGAVFSGGVFSSRSSGENRFLRESHGLAVVAIVTVNCIGFVPVRLADLPALAFFSAAVVIGYKLLDLGPGRTKNMMYLALGGLVCASAFLKQTYLAYGAILLIATVVFDPARGSAKALGRPLAWFGIGMAPYLLQFLAVYFKTGVFWAYDPAAIAGFGPANEKPVVELVAYSLPKASAYLVRVVNDVNEVTYFLLKLYKGLFEFAMPVYRGEMPFPESWTLTLPALVGVQVLGLLYLLFTGFCAGFGPPGIRLASLTALGWAAFTAWMGHAEDRYFVFPRIVLWAALAYWLLVLLQKIRRRSGTPVAN